jgi:hypothetical protein
MILLYGVSGLRVSDWVKEWVNDQVSESVREEVKMWDSEVVIEWRSELMSDIGRVSELVSRFVNEVCELVNEWKLVSEWVSRWVDV